MTFKNQTFCFSPTEVELLKCM